MERSLGLIVSFVFLLRLPLSSGDSAGNLTVNRLAPVTKDLCADVIQRYRHYSCAQHIVQTTDGYKLGLHRVSSYEGSLRETRHPAVLLLHGLFVAGDAWFLDSVNQSLGYILTDSGFDVWVGNARGTRWSHGHVSLSERDKEFWDWSWEDLAVYDFSAMLHHVNTVTNSKIFVVGHSQGTIISLAAFTETDIVDMVAGAALLAPISYLGHVSSPLVLRMVGMHLDEVIRALGIHQLNFWSDIAVQLMDSLCDGHVDCNDMLSALTGPNCCMNMSRVDFYLDYEPHPSSVKNLNHLFQMIRKGTFSKYDYGKFRNLKKYGHFKPPVFDLSRIPKSLPLWMGYGGNDALANTIDLQQTLNELQSTPEMLYLENYGHVDFVLSTSAKTDVYDNMISFFWSLLGRSSSF